MMSLWQRAGRAGRGGKEGAVVLLAADTPLDSFYASNPDALFARPPEPLILNLGNERVRNAHYACAVKECGGVESSLNLAVLGAEAASVKKQRDAGGLDDDVFYTDDPHRRVRVRGGGDEAYTLVCGGEEIGQIDPYHVLRESPRNGIYFHDGKAYRVKDVNGHSRQIRLEHEYSLKRTQSFVSSNIKVTGMSDRLKYPGALVARAKLRVTEFLQNVTEKAPSGETTMNWPGSAGMKPNVLPTEGTVVQFLPPAWAAYVRTVPSPAVADGALAAAARLFAGLFPTVSGPCDASDFAADSDVRPDGSAAIYLYDSVPYGIGLAYGAFDRLVDLTARAAEVIAKCDCPDDAGCFKCVKNPRMEDRTSKAATADLLSVLSAILSERATFFGAEADAVTAVSGPACCGDCGYEQPKRFAFCPQCGAKQPEAT